MMFERLEELENRVENLESQIAGLKETVASLEKKTQDWQPIEEVAQNMAERLRHPETYFPEGVFTRTNRHEATRDTSAED